MRLTLLLKDSDRKFIDPRSFYTLLNVPSQMFN